MGNTNKKALMEQVCNNVSLMKSASKTETNTPIICEKRGIFCECGKEEGNLKTAVNYTPILIGKLRNP